MQFLHVIAALASGCAVFFGVHGEVEMANELAQEGGGGRSGGRRLLRRTAADFEAGITEAFKDAQQPAAYSTLYLNDTDVLEKLKWDLDGKEFDNPLYPSDLPELDEWIKIRGADGTVQVGLIGHSDRICFFEYQKLRDAVDGKLEWVESDIMVQKYLQMCSSAAVVLTTRAKEKFAKGEGSVKQKCTDAVVNNSDVVFANTAARFVDLLLKVTATNKDAPRDSKSVEMLLKLTSVTQKTKVEIHRLERWIDLCTRFL